MSNPNESSVMVDKEDFKRLEEKVDQLGNALGKLILFEDRQARMGERLGEMDRTIVGNYTDLLSKYSAYSESANKRITELKDQVNRWQNLVLGGWAVFTVTVSVAVTAYKMLH